MEKLSFEEIKIKVFWGSRWPVLADVVCKCEVKDMKQTKNEIWWQLNNQVLDQIVLIK
jgi:hypothetical protein